MENFKEKQFEIFYNYKGEKQNIQLSIETLLTDDYKEYEGEYIWHNVLDELRKKHKGMNHITSISIVCIE